jgi:FkbM family methyltransferase
LAELNIGFRHPTSRWRILCCAVAYTADEVYFNAGQEHVAGRIATTPHGDGGPISKVQARTLSSILRQHSVGEYSLVIDVEGAEHELIAHDKEALSKCRCIIAELHGNSKDKQAFCEALTSIGMRIVEQKHSVVAFLRL